MKENKEMERVHFSGWGWTLGQSEEPMMQVEALNKQLLDSWDDVII